MRSMFQAGFQREIFSQRHPQMGISFADLETDWKKYYPIAKADLKSFENVQVPMTTYPPGTVTSPTNLRSQLPSSSSVGTAVLAVGGLAIVAGAAYYILKTPKPFAFLKK